jgi:beta-glucosidase
MPDAKLTFPKDFLWGIATAAHHVEGGLINSWSRWEEMETGAVYMNQRHGRACEWWDGRWREDFERMEYLGTNTHRLSIEWSRIQPTRDEINDAAIQQYRDMLEDLNRRNIRPMVTLHHFTNPLWLEDVGGWVEGQAVDSFGRWAEIAVDAFGDQVDLWCTFNEPMVYVVQAYLVAMFYPGKRSPRQALKVAEHLLRAHEAAYHIIKERYPAAEVGLAKHLLRFDTLAPHFINRIPVNFVRWLFNDAFMETFATGVMRFPFRRSVHLPGLPETLDYYGLNFYQRYRGGIAPLSPRTFFLKQVPEPDAPYSPPMWGEIYPQGLFDMIERSWLTYRKPIYITETGTPDKGDSIRRWYIAMALHNIWRAINYCYPVKGIYYWTLMDNFEWTAAYNPEFRFGLYEMDFETQQRTLRRSGEFYREIAHANALSSDMVREFVPELFDKFFPGQAGQREVSLKPRT